MRPITTVVIAAALSIGLSACFTSDNGLIDDDSATAPFEKISFKAAGDDNATVAVRDGKAYVVEGQDTLIEMRFLEIAADTYLVEVTGEEDGATLRLYGALVVDQTAGSAATYAVIGAQELAGPGLRVCPDSTICIDDLNAYAELAMGQIASGTEPAATYTFSAE